MFMVYSRYPFVLNALFCPCQKRKPSGQEPHPPQAQRTSAPQQGKPRR